MKLSDLEQGKSVTITKTDCDDELKQRFYSFGIIKGAILEIEKISFSKNTIVLVIDDTSIALRLSEAKYIEVE